MGIKIITIQFTKINKCDNIELKKWLDLITRKDFSDYEGSEGMMEAVEKIVEMNSDEKTMHQIIKEEMKYLDEISEKKAIERKLNAAKEEGMELGLEQGMEQGIEKGIEQGAAKERVEIIKKLYLKNKSLDFISEMLDITKEEIEEIIKNM